MVHRILLRRVSVLALLSLSAAGCRSRSVVQGTAAPAPSASASAGTGDLNVITEEQQRKVLNPGNDPAYSGPIGTVRGIVHASGDPAPELPAVLAKIPAGKCDDARAFYGKLFREGPNRELGDVLVAVTEYKGFIPPVSRAKTVLARGCAFESRTIAMVYGQRLDVVNRSPEAFIPELKGAHQPALLVAVPGGDPVSLYPDHVGQFLLIDHTYAFATADVFVLKYPTAMVTGIDGNFEFPGIPAGDATVTAYLPATMKQASQKVHVVAGETITLDLTVPFTASKPSPSPSAAP
jgi:hypothetical protein